MSTLIDHSWAGYPGLEPVIDACVLELTNLVNRKYICDEKNFRPLDFGLATQYLPLDVITALSSGKAFSYCVNDADLYDYLKDNGE